MNYKNKTIRNSLICYFLIVVFFVSLRILSYLGLLSFLGSTGEIVANIVIQIGFLFSISIFLFAGLQKNKPKDVFVFYGYKKMSWKAVFYAFLIGIVVYILNVFVAAFFNSILQAFGYSFSSSSSSGGSYPFWLFIVNLIMTAVLPAICEETAHRGMLLKSMSTLGYKKAIIISALLFGLLHLNIEQFFYATIIGLYLGYISVLCDTIYPAMIVHFMNNAIGVLMSYATANGVPLNAMFSWIDYSLANNPIIGLIFVIALVVLLVYALKALTKLLFKETAVKNINRLQIALITQLEREKYLSDVKNIIENKPVNEETTIEFEQFDKIYKEQVIDTGNGSEIDNALLSEETVPKNEKLSKTLLIITFVLTGALTLFTFIWGVI